MIRVLIVDDSALVRKILTQMLSAYPDIEVVGAAVDPYVARDKIVALRPDVITLDIQMPRMDGLSFLGKLMRHHPVPVVVLSAVTPRDSDCAMKALALGAVEVIGKPGPASSTAELGPELARAIRGAAAARIVVPPAPRPSRAVPRPESPTRQLLAIGASTGGTQAIEGLLSTFPGDGPAVLVVQHMPPGFTAAFARRLNGLCAMEVREARDRDPVEPGVALVAAGGRHMELHQDGSRWIVRLTDGPYVCMQRPSVDVLFASVARAAGRQAVGVILTGMGRDGADGLLAMRAAGARTIAQDEESCVVFGMPREAIRLGAARQVASLAEMPEAIRRALG